MYVMRNRIIHNIFLILALALVVACTHDPLSVADIEEGEESGVGESISSPSPITIVANSEQTETKTGLGENYSVVWSEGDEFSVLQEPVGTGDVTWTVSTNYSTYQTYALSNINDGDTSTYFWSNGAQTTGYYVLVTFSDYVNLKSFSTYSSNSTDMPKDCNELQVSVDGSSWNTVGTFTNTATSTFSDIGDVGKGIKYARIYATSTISNWLVINEITMDYSSVNGGSSDNYRFTLTSGAGEHTASFTGTLSAGANIEQLYALYPYSESASFDGENIHFSLPQEQVYSFNSFAPNINPSIGVYDEDGIEFKNLCGILRLALLGNESVRSIEITDNAESPLWGNVSLPVSTVGSSVSAIVDGSIISSGTSSLTLSCPSSVQLSTETPTYFYFVVPVGSFAYGFTAVVNTDYGTQTFSTVKNNSIHRSKVRMMPAVSLNITHTDALWENGGDIEIAEQTFSKANSNLSSVTVSQNTIVNDSSLENKIVFVNPNSTLTIGNNATLKNTIIVSQSESETATVEVEGVASSSSSKFSTKATSSSSINVSGMVAFKNVSLSSDVVFSGSSLNKLYIDGCKISVSSSGSSLLNLGSNGSTTLEEYSLVGNVFHSSTSSTQRTYSIASNCSSMRFTKMMVKDNVFLDVKGDSSNSGALAYANRIDNLTLSRNLFYYDSELSDSFSIVKVNSQPSGSTDIDSNTCYPSGGAGDVSTYCVGSTVSGTADGFMTSPFSSVNIVSGRFEYSSAYPYVNYIIDGEVRAATVSGDKLKLLHIPAISDNIKLCYLPGDRDYSLSGSWSSSKSLIVNDGASSRTYTFDFPDIIDSSTSQTLASNNSGWVTVWSDEFNGTDFDRDVWVRCPAGNPDWKKEQYPDDESLVQVTDGHLVTWGKKDSDTSKGNGGYICGGIWGKDLKGFNLGMNGVNGRIDVRARMTDAQGYWPAIWMLSQPQQTWAFGGEIDLMEHLNYEDTAYLTLHWSENKADEDIKNNAYDTSFTDRTDWHVFTVLIADDTICMYVDGAQYMSYEKGSKTALQWPWDTTEYFLIMDSQLNGGWVGDATGADLPAHMDIDYVRYMVKN